MPCTVKKTFEAARDTGEFLVVQVKANQQTLSQAIEEICATETPVDSANTVDRNRHGRQEHRRVETFDVTGVSDPLGWPDQHRRPCHPVHLAQGYQDRPVARNLRGSPLCVANPPVRHRHRRRHPPASGIENRSHYVRDVTFGEDQSRIRSKPAQFARLRSFALNILRANGTTNVRRELYLNALNPQNALSYQIT